MTTKTVKVPGISCGHCVMTIEREVGELEGVSSVKAEQASRDVTVAGCRLGSAFGSDHLPLIVDLYVP